MSTMSETAKIQLDPIEVVAADTTKKRSITRSKITCLETGDGANWRENRIVCQGVYPSRAARANEVELLLQA